MTLFKIIPRGRVYHSLSKDILDMFRALFSKRDLQKVSHFEKTIAEYMKSNHCIAFSFARTAFYFSLKAVNIPENSEIIMPPITIKPFLDVVLCLKLKPVFVDLDPDTLCYDCNQLEKAITKNTKAINITYLYGITPDMDPIINIAKRTLTIIPKRVSKLRLLKIPAKNTDQVSLLFSHINLFTFSIQYTPTNVKAEQT